MGRLLLVKRNEEWESEDVAFETYWYFRISRILKCSTSSYNEAVNILTYIQTFFTQILNIQETKKYPAELARPPLITWNFLSEKNIFCEVGPDSKFLYTNLEHPRTQKVSGRACEATPDHMKLSFRKKYFLRGGPRLGARGTPRTSIYIIRDILRSFSSNKRNVKFGKH